MVRLIEIRRTSSRWLAAGLLLFGAPSRLPAQPTFTDVTLAAGVNFVHYTGAAQRKYLPETMGAGLALFDSDGDGDFDLYLVNGAPLPGTPSPPALPANALYRNDGAPQGTWNFTAVPGAGGAADTSYGMGCCSGDYDGDGDVDLYITNHGPNRLYNNRGDGTFDEIGQQARVAHPGWSTGCAFADFDGDGLPDLYVVNYLQDTVAQSASCLQDGRPFYCHPRRFPASPDALYRNLGNGTFADISDSAGIANDRQGKGLGLAIFDYDRDGDPDAYIANDTTPNFLYRNDGGHFAEVGEITGVAYNEDARPEAGMGIAVGNIDNRAGPDLLVTNFELETNTLYVNQGDGFFSDMTYIAGLGQASLPHLGFAALFFDGDNDGDEDLFVANGHIQTDLRLHDGRIGADEPDQFFINDGDGTFTDISAHSGPYFKRRLTSRGAAVADIDLDGDLDLAISHSGQPPTLLRNDAVGGHWLVVRPTGPLAGPGLQLQLRAGQRTWTRQLVGGGSYLSQGDHGAWFGLGQAPQVDSLTITLPGGTQRHYLNIGIDTIFTPHLAGPASKAP